MGGWKPLVRWKVLEWSIFNKDTMCSHLKRIAQVCSHGGDVESFMEEQDVGLEGDGTVICNCNRSNGCS